MGEEDPFDDVLRAFAVDFTEADPLGEIDADEVYHQALERGLLTEAQLDADFERFLDRPVVNQERAQLDPIGELSRLVEDAGGTMRYNGRPVSEAELRIAVADSAADRILDAVTVRAPGLETGWSGADDDEVGE